MEDATDNLSAGSLSLAKCWQGQEPFLCFQATWSTRVNDVTRRLRGFLLIDGRRGNQPFQWLSDKPEDLVAQGSAAALIRKFMPSAHVINLTSHEDTRESSQSYVGLLLRTSGNDEPDETKFFIAVSGTTNPHLEFIANTGQSLFRWNSQGCYTVRKTAEPHLAQALQESENKAAVTLLMSSINTILGSKTVDPASQEPENPTTLPLHQREARDRVARRLKTLRKTLNQDQKKLPLTHELGTLKTHAEAFRSWIHLAKEGDHELILSPEMSGQLNSLVIPLNPDLTAGENLNAMFQRMQKMERGLELGQKRVSLIQQQIKSMETVLELLRTASPLQPSEVNQLLARCGLQAKLTIKPLNSPQAKQEKNAIGRTFISADAAVMILGRTAAENDQITKSAKSNDWWFHVASGVHGTHVIVPARSLKKGDLSAVTIREAMILAVHFSNLALSKEGEVYITKRSALKKSKGAPAGLWQINRSETMMVRYTDSELKAIFAREKRHGTIRHTTEPDS